MIDPEAIPAEIRNLKQFVCWRYEDRDGKQTKVPVKPWIRGGRASTTKPDTWDTLWNALARLKRDPGVDGVGFVFNDDYIGIDLDHAVDDHGAFKPWAAEIMAACPTYQELSPSGTGVHLIVKGKLPGRGHNKRNFADGGGLEVYSRGRYFTITGNRIPTAPPEITDQSDYVTELYRKLEGNGKGRKADYPKPGAKPRQDDDDRLEVALRDGVFSRLWYGDVSGNGGDDSAADLALCNKIAFYWGPDPTVIDSIFRQSRLMRDKWEREDYRTWTINKAIDGCRETYTPPKVGNGTGRTHRQTEAVSDPGAENSDEAPLDTAEKPALANLNNAVRIIERDPDFCRVWFDDFQQRILTGDPPREWGDHDDVNLQLRFQREKGIPRMARDTAANAVTAIAFRHRRNCVKDWLESLRWDGRDRLNHFFEDYYGTPSTPYTQAAGRNFLISMVARIYRSGCQVDTMPVLEGPQGILKSSSLRVLAGDYHCEQHESVTSKDFFQNLQGKWLIEISEMDSFSRNETSKVKQVITCTTDHFRPSYGRRAVDHPRMCVFAGTTNRDDWNQDETGARRFWPIACTEIDLNGIRNAREQLFAEAVARFKAGENWWTMPAEETRQQQEARYAEDAWSELIHSFVRTQSKVSVLQIMQECLKVDTAARIQKADQMRVATCLRRLGWERGRNERVNGEQVRFWRLKDEKGGNN